mgnify:CR=1 FL=1
MEQSIIRTEYSELMQKSYIDYAMSVIIARALPDVRDGLKPVQRRTLYDMYELGIRYDKPYRKSARIVGDTMGKYHPHGDSSIYDALVVMAQDFKKGLPLVDGHGNFGSIEGDGAAAMRYTEARLQKVTQEAYLADLDKNVVDFMPNFDETEKEPVVLPVKVPNLLVNGAEVGAVIASPVERLTRNTDINFDKQQRQTSWLIVALATLLAALATFLLARGLLAPVKRLVDGTHKLAAGDFTTRVTPTSEDELGKLAQDFNQLASTLEKNQQMRRDFMADISHELRTPLAVLRGELEAIQDGVRKFTPETVASLQAEVGTLTKLVEDLDQWSISDEGALAYQKAPVDLIPLLEVAGGAFRERFASRGLKLQFSLPDSITVFGDRDRLMQLFNNLLENSLRYTDSGGSLQISAGQRDKTVRLTFADSAPGVSDDQLQKLFERFYRTEGSRNRASGGSGLGLAICLNIVEAHNGRIIAAHSPFGGVSITVELPLERDLQREV